MERNIYADYLTKYETDNDMVYRSSAKSFIKIITILLFDVTEILFSNFFSFLFPFPVVEKRKQGYCHNFIKILYIFLSKLH